MATSSNVVPLSAVQPAASSTLAAPVEINVGALQALAATLSSKFTQYESDRRLAELKWMRNARQYLGIYDPEVDAAIPKNRSRAYPKLTRVKCVSMLSRIMNLMFQASDKNWGVSPSAVPDLSQADLQSVLDQLYPPDSPEGTPVPNDEQIERAIWEFAKKRAARMEREIEDQLQELGGNKAQSYVHLSRCVLASGIQYGAGVLRGPFVEEQEQRTWTMANGRLSAIKKTAYRPRFEFVPLWDYYPDMGAKCFDQMDGQFLRQVMSRAQLLALKQRPDFISKQIDQVMRQVPFGNYKRKAFETDLRSMGAQMNTPSGETGKYEAIVWDGMVSGQALSAAGVRVPQDKINDAVRAQVWMVDGIAIKAEVDPWVTLMPNKPMKQYHHFIFEEDESFLLGNGLPNIMRDSQMGLNAAVRMALDNGSVQRVFELNRALIQLDQDITMINPDQVIQRDDDNPATAGVPAVRAVELPMAIPQMQALATMFQGFADQETFVGPATGGDMQKGPSEPFRTAAGASMLRGDAALPFKDVVRNFDVFTESVIGAILLFNQKFNDNPNIQGDYTAVAKGATTLIAKEVQGIQLDNIAQTLTEEEKPYLNPRALLRARVKVRDMDPTEVVYDDARCDQIDAQRAQGVQQAQEQASRAAEANIRKVLSDVLKNVAQANKNAAGAEAQTANVILAALEKGLNPDMLAATPSQQPGDPNGNGAPGGTNTGTNPAGAGAGQQQRAGLAGLEAATGAAAASPGSRAAAMPAG